MIDLATMQQVDTNTTTAGAQPLDLTVDADGSTARSVLFTSDSSKLVIGYSGADAFDQNDGTITSVSTTTWASTAVAPSPAVADGGSVAKMVRAPDGSIWVLRNNDSGLSVFSSDLATEARYDTQYNSGDAVNEPGSPQMIAFTPDGARAYIGLGSEELAIFAVATRTREDHDGVAGAPVVNVTMPRVGGHFALITPF